MVAYGIYTIKHCYRKEIAAMDNTVTPVISASDVSAIGTELKANISAVAPAVLGVMAITIVVAVVLRLIKRFAK